VPQLSGALCAGGDIDAIRMLMTGCASTNAPSASALGGTIGVDATFWLLEGCSCLHVSRIASYLALDAGA
jgi:hypothetical protein